MCLALGTVNGSYNTVSIILIQHTLIGEKKLLYSVEVTTAGGRSDSLNVDFQLIMADEIGILSLIALCI